MLGFAHLRKWVYVQHVDGRFQRLRRWTFLALYLILFVTPWVPVRGYPALRFDLLDRRLYAFGAIFTASDTLLLLLLLLFLAFSLFFFTSLFGRLWCGYACPQTVFLDGLVRPIERWIEGEWTTRRRRDAGPLTWDKARRKMTFRRPEWREAPDHEQHGGFEADLWPGVPLPGGAELRVPPLVLPEATALTDALRTALRAATGQPIPFLPLPGDPAPLHALRTLTPEATAFRGPARAWELAFEGISRLPAPPHFCARC